MVITCMLDHGARRTAVAFGVPTGELLPPGHALTTWWSIRLLAVSRMVSSRGRMVQPSSRLALSALTSSLADVAQGHADGRIEPRDHPHEPVREARVGTR